MHFPISNRAHSSASRAKLVAAHDDTTDASIGEQKRLTPRERSEKEKHRKIRQPDVAAEMRSNALVNNYVHEIARATPLELIDIERLGVPGEILKNLARKMSMPISHLYKILGIAKATAEKKTTAGEFVTGSSGHAAIGMIKLLGSAQSMAANSTAAKTADFDVGKWLGQWIECPQAALGGRKPAELIDTPTGVDVVARLLGSIESGAYQ